MQEIIDSVWVLTAAFLVFFMHAGFALVESGFCRRKNVVMVLLKNVSVVAVASLLFYAVGFGLMFGGGSPWIGLEGFAPSAGASVAGAATNLPLFVFLFFQLVFAPTAATIVSGAVAERASLLPFLLFTSLASAVLYPIVGHQVWGGGFLATETSFHDFAGSTVVHAVGGAMALAGATIVDAKIYTLTNGKALDIFWVQDTEGDAFDDPDRLKRLERRIMESLSGEIVPRREFQDRAAKRAHAHLFVVPPRVLIDNAASATHTVIEVNGRDRPGLLYEVTRAITDLGLQISSAKISTYGKRVVDVFYVKDVFGMKVEHEAKLDAIRARLLGALSDPNAPSPPGATTTKDAVGSERAPAAR